MQEIRKTTFSMKGHKSPSPDGVLLCFGEELVSEVESFFAGGHLLLEMNENFITIIPKVDRPDKVTKFRPISLCNTSYKIISKCLVRRLRRIMGDLISESQNAFISGRSISDNCLAAHEMLIILKKKGTTENASIFNVDLNKAYDRIS